MAGSFPFGAPLLPCADGLPDRRYGAFLLGAYPSALHVRWTPPPGLKLRAIAALAVDNEPVPFWDGSDAEDRVSEWRRQWFNQEWGKVSAPTGLNGPSGAWVRDNVITRLTTGDCYITDCLTTYRSSRGQAQRVKDTYEPFSSEHDLPKADLPGHPTEADIVKEAVAENRQRLERQIAAADPLVLITLGNAAARTIAHLSGARQGGAITETSYGSERVATIAGRDIRWLPLVHPGAPSVWLLRHAKWLDALPQ